MQNIISYFCTFEMKYAFLWHSRNIYCVILCSCINTQDRKIGRSVWDKSACNVPLWRDRGHMITCHTKATKRQEEIKFLTILPLSFSLSLTRLVALVLKLTDTSSQWARWISAALLEELWSLVWPHLYTFTHKHTALFQHATRHPTQNVLQTTLLTYFYYPFLV